MWTAEPATIQGKKKARRNQLQSTRKIFDWRMVSY